MSRPQSDPCDPVRGSAQRCLCSWIYVVVMLPIVAAALLCVGVALAIETASKSLMPSEHAQPARELDSGHMQSAWAVPHQVGAQHPT